MYPGYNMIINTILVFYAIKKLDADSSKQVRIWQPPNHNNNESLSYILQVIYLINGYLV